MEAKWEENDVKCFDFANGSASPAPKANKGLVKAKFYTEMANAKNAPALGVRVPGRSGCSAPWIHDYACKGRMRARSFFWSIVTIAPSSRCFLNW